MTCAVLEACPIRIHLKELLWYGTGTMYFAILGFLSYITTIIRDVFETEMKKKPVK